MKSTIAFLLSFLLCNAATAFVVMPQPSPATMMNARSTIRLQAGQRDSDGGGAALAKPDVKIAQKTETVAKEKIKQKQKAKTHDPISRRKDEFEDAPMFKLMLLGDDGYDAMHVVDRLCAIVDDIDEGQAAEVLQQANMAGKAMCGKYPFERAELFKEQLLRSDPMIFSDLEEENK
uniref:Adaptor protein ClpS core domain-containing protein n=1 Tax=Craspedostauros australis TaxID=1486917 RepID=A0A7R9WV01_9STRA|mmetsp:Transcript_19793/g.55049  ORF Transcript_19793/g.55049 Transcript_19793/m.55049 type:complete len:176 (+) Transcript_19793:74-601(+)